PLPFRADRAPQEVDGDVGAAIAGRGDAPEDQHAEQQAPEIVGIRDRPAEEITQQDGHESVDRDQPDEKRRRPLDRVDETVGVLLVHTQARSRRADRPDRTSGRRRGDNAQYAALYFLSSACSSPITWSGLRPAFFTLSAHFWRNGSAAFFHWST